MVKLFKIILAPPSINFMNKNIPSILALVICMIIPLISNAQLKVGVNAGVAFPTGDLGAFSQVGYGAGISAEYLLLDKKFGIGASANFTTFSFRYIPQAGSTTLAPLALLARYYISTGSVKPFVGVDFGIYYVKISDYYGNYGSKLNPGIAPIGGFAIKLTEQVDLNLAAKYNVVFSSTFAEASTFTFLGLQAGTAITFGK